jgi:PIN domain nuclease of toxin-antitoxin system
VKLLLDTQLLLLASAGSIRLSAAARKLVNDPANDIIFSVVSIWEIAIKQANGFPDLAADPRLMREEALRNGYLELDVFGPHAIGVSNLPPIHKDPFDRLLIAQATVEGITLLTADATIARYSGPIRKV